MNHLTAGSGPSADDWNTPWTQVTYASGNFTASGSMTWTVDSGDQIDFKYAIVDKVMIVCFDLNTTTVGGTPSTELLIAIPASKTANTRARNPVLINIGGTGEIGAAFIAASATVIQIQRVTGSTFPNSTNGTIVSGQIVIEIQ